MDNITTWDKKITEGFIGQKMMVLPADKKKQLARNPLAKHLYPTAIGYYPHASYHDRERKTGSQQYILLYCVDGKGWIKISGQEHVVSPNTFFIIPQGVSHHYGSSQKEPWSIYWLHFSGEQTGLLYERYAQISGRAIQNIAYADSRIAVFNKLVNLLENDLDAATTEAVYINLLQFISSFIYTGIATAKVENDAIAISIAMMKQNIEHNYTIKQLAGHARYSVSRYSELFRLKTGFAPIQYFLQLKIQRSCEYLIFTKMNIKEICTEVGFDDPYYFSRMFKKQMGQSPLKYRKMNPSPVEEGT
jgi:AraC family transcriptional regulator, arabinose operon regulatory protein